LVIITRNHQNGLRKSTRRAVAYWVLSWSVAACSESILLLECSLETSFRGFMFTRVRQVSCEFGPCGDSFGPSSHRRGNCQFIFGNRGFSGQDFFAWLGLYELANNTVQVGKFHANAHQITYENYWGPGGSGPDLSGHDTGCHVHDVCYDTHGLKILNNFNRGFPGTSALHGCNQQLCNAVPGTLVDKYFSGPGSLFGGRCSR
jgi:hypothetical protein